MTSRCSDVERAHWLSITDDPDWRRNHINDPNISTTDTLDIIQRAFPATPKRILDIGCGYGRLTREMHTRYPDAEICGIDVNPDILNDAKAHDPDTEFICGDNLFGLLADAVYSVAVFQHLPDNEKRAYINQAHDALTVGGVLVVQFIEGDLDRHLEHWTPAEQMLAWARDAGFSAWVATGVVHHQWSWMTAIKGS